MTKLIEDLKAAGWVETTLGECRPGEEVVIVDNGHVRHEFITRADEVRGTVSDAKGFQWAAETPAQRPPRPPRPECAPGTVALITWDEDKPLVRAWKVPGQWIPTGGIPLDDDSVEVVRVLLPADQDTPAVEVTDEMVERGAEEIYRARYKEPNYGPQWVEVCEDSPAEADLYRWEARRLLKAALGVEK